MDPGYWILYENRVNNMLTWSRDMWHGCLCDLLVAGFAHLFVNQGICLQDREATEYVQCLPQKMDWTATWLDALNSQNINSTKNPLLCPDEFVIKDTSTLLFGQNPYTFSFQTKLERIFSCQDDTVFSICYDILDMIWLWWYDMIWYDVIWYDMIDVLWRRLMWPR